MQLSPPNPSRGGMTPHMLSSLALFPAAQRPPLPGGSQAGLSLSPVTTIAHPHAHQGLRWGCSLGSCHRRSWSLMAPRKARQKTHKQGQSGSPPAHAQALCRPLHTLWCKEWIAPCRLQGGKGSLKCSTGNQFRNRLAGPPSSHPSKASGFVYSPQAETEWAVQLLKNRGVVLFSLGKLLLCFCFKADSAIEPD